MKSAVTRSILLCGYAAFAIGLASNSEAKGATNSGASLQLAQNAFGCHLALQVLDGALDAFVADLHFERLTLNGICGVRQGTALLTCLFRQGNSRERFTPRFSARKMSSCRTRTASAPRT